MIVYRMTQTEFCYLSRICSNEKIPEWVRPSDEWTEEAIVASLEKKEMLQSVGTEQVVLHPVMEYLFDCMVKATAWLVSTAESVLYITDDTCILLDKSVK